MRSAIYYPRTQIQSRQIMQSSLLLWDRLYTIIPEPEFKPAYDDRRDMAEAWELIGATLFPNDEQKERAHAAIADTLKTGLPSDMYYVGQVDRPGDPYEIWPQQLANETFKLLMQHRLTPGQLSNGDFPVTEEAGLLVMAKLADACAGTLFARVTDRLMAYGMIGSGDKTPHFEADVIPITLDIVDCSGIPLENLIAFRKREKTERRGRDYTKLRHNYADMVQRQISTLGAAKDQFERDELNSQFRSEIETQIKDLRDELGGDKINLVLKPIIVATVVAGGSLLAGGSSVGAALTASAIAAVGSSLTDVAKTVADFFSEGFNFDRKQVDTMAKYPIAYMYALSSRS